jgi:hypothetical protein
METKVGDTVRSILNGIEYKVKRIVRRMAVLESKDGKSQILTELENLKLFYKKREEKPYETRYDESPSRHIVF